MTSRFLSTSKSVFLIAVLSCMGTVALAQNAASSAKPSAPPVAPPNVTAPDKAQPQQGASEPMRQKMGERRQEWQKHMKDRRSRMLERFKFALGIKSEQEAAWNTFVAALQPSQDEMMDMGNTAKEWARLTTPDRIDRMESMLAKHQEKMHKTGEAIKNFYAQLNADQKKIFDDKSMYVAMHMMHQRGGMRGWRGSHQGMEMGDNGGEHGGAHGPRMHPMIAKPMEPSSGAK